MEISARKKSPPSKLSIVVLYPGYNLSLNFEISIYNNNNKINHKYKYILYYISNNLVRLSILILNGMNTYNIISVRV